MKRTLLLASTLGLLTSMLLFTHVLVMAQGAIYELSLSLLGSGGAISGGAYTLALTVGDPKAAETLGGAYSLGGGLLGGGVRVVAPVAPTATPMATPSPTGSTATPQPLSPTATMTPTPPGNTASTVKLFLPLVER